MKKSRLLLGLALISMVTTGCDFLDNISGGGNQQEEKKDDKKKTIEPESISLSEETIVLNVDESTSIEHTVLPQEASQEVKYESFNRDVAIVYANGSIYGAGEGETTVRVISKVKESVYRDIYVIVEEELPPVPPIPGETFTVSYNANGGSGTITDSNEYEAGNTVTVKANTFTRTNYNFVNFNTKANGSGTSYAPGATFTINSNVTLYAQWEADTPIVTNYTVTFNGNGSTSGNMANDTTSGSTYTTPTCGFSKTNYTFDGWALNSASGTKYLVGSTISGITANITLYATWAESGSGGDDFNGYYNSIQSSWTGTTLLNGLNSIIDTSSVSVSYDWYRFETADLDPNSPNHVICIYSRKSMSFSAEDHGTDGDYWNREHTFPQSKMGNSKSKNDNHIIYASEKKVNGARGNIMMGQIDSGGEVVNDNNGNPTTCVKTSSKFDPRNLARGIVARTTMYAAAMYGFDPEENFESVETMLRWHLEYLPNADDARRNEVVYGNQHNRNPFVDHPEYACKIWGETNSTTKSICGIN